MFVGREAELQQLREWIASERFEMIPVYGRRRVGKTRLLDELVKDYDHVFFTADQVGAESNLQNLSQAIQMLISGSPSGEAPVYPSFQAAFEAVARYAEKTEKKIVFVIDEYPYLAKSSEGISSVLQRTIDREYLSLSNLMLILTGSQMSFMEKQVLGYKSPLYGRRTGQIKLQPLSYQESRSFLPTMDRNDFLTIYGLTGGIPLYLSYMKDELSLKENLLATIFHPNTFLYEEPANLLLQELRNPERYNDIITAIATGAGEVKEITNETGLDSATLTKYLATLIDLNIIGKKAPISKIGKKRGLYFVQDGLFRFWYRYVPIYRNLINTNQIGVVWEEIAADLPIFTSITFEAFCRDWVIRQNSKGTLPYVIAEVGSWWGTDPSVHHKGAGQEEVGIVGLGTNKNNLLLGECKWRNQGTDQAVLEKLVYRSSFFPYQNKYLMVFSKSEFTKGAQEYGQQAGIKLVTFAEMQD